MKEDGHMNKRLSIVLPILLCVVLLGCCGQKTDTLTYLAQETVSTTSESMSYEVDLGERVSKATVTAEYWKAGKMVDQVALVLDDSTTMLSALFDVASLDEETKEKVVNLQMNVDSSNQDNHEVVMRQFSLPANVCGYIVESGEDAEKLEVAPGDELLLGGLAFDLGQGVAGIDKRGLIEEPDRFKDYECIVVIRATFE